MQWMRKVSIEYREKKERPRKAQNQARSEGRLDATYLYSGTLEIEVPGIKKWDTDEARDSKRD